MTTANESRPGGGSEAAEGVVATHPQDTGATLAPRLSDLEIERAIPLWVVIVRTPSDRIGRRVYLSLHGASKAAQRALDRGQDVHVELCSVIPEGVAVDA